jgi:hypothetical protein
MRSVMKPIIPSTGNAWRAHSAFPAPPQVRKRFSFVCDFAQLFRCGGINAAFSNLYASITRPGDYPRCTDLMNGN